MASNISELIYGTFFENLEKSGKLMPETIEALKVLHASGKISSKSDLLKLAKAMEERHVQNQNA